MGRITRKPSQKLTKHELDTSGDAKVLLTQLIPVAQDSELVQLVGWRDNRGNLRRARAVYDNGWTADIFLTLPRAGQVYLSSYRLNWKGIARPDRLPG